MPRNWARDAEPAGLSLQTIALYGSNIDWHRDNLRVTSTPVHTMAQLHSAAKQPNWLSPSIRVFRQRQPGAQFPADART